MNHTNKLMQRFIISITFLSLTLALQPTSLWAQSTPTLEDLATQIEVLTQQVYDQQQIINDLQTNTVLDLDGFLTLNTDNNGYLTAHFDSVNVQITNGLGYTPGVDALYPEIGVVNGLGNLIVGYNESPVITDDVCSIGTYDNRTDCLNNGHAWGNNQKTGSHNVVIGRGHNYTRFGGLVAGFENTINGQWSTITGGVRNISSGHSSSVSGGESNLAIGNSSMAMGGHGNIASGDIGATVSGGIFNIASGRYSSTNGGSRNVANGIQSSISGGIFNNAKGLSSSVTGGAYNIANGDTSSVTGGTENEASGINSSVSGGSRNEAAGYQSVVSGGLTRNASKAYDWTAGSLQEDQ